MPVSPDLKSAFAAAVPKLNNAERIGGAEQLAMARGLMDRALQSGKPEEVSRAADFAHYHGFSAGRIATGRVQSGVAQARGGGNVAAWTEQYQSVDPRVTVDPQVRVAFVPDLGGRDDRGKEHVHQEQYLGIRQGPDGLAELAGRHAAAIARPDHEVEHEYSGNLIVGGLQRLAEAATGRSWHTELDTSVPESQPRNAAAMTEQIVSKVTRAAVSQIPPTKVAAAARTSAVQNKVERSTAYIKAAAAAEAERNHQDYMEEWNDYRRQAGYI